eukprot:gb/GEZN01009568.1/.p2 GENE.gb/GEZN01009568.1/~~gb/GEZN01009568.1/.p2  ORF type:complete len:113 (+),score=28.39 gb/GEZN01009568.1/:133-471(+)
MGKKKEREKAASVVDCGHAVLNTTSMADEAPAESASSKAASSNESENLTLFVQNLLTQMQGRFQTMSDQIIGRIDQMGERIDEMEKSIADLMAQAGMDEQGKDKDKDASAAQ